MKYGIPLVLLLFTASTFSQDDGYLENYKKGLKSYRDKDYSEANSHLKRSYDTKNNSITAYFLSFSLYKTKDYEKSMHYAKKALSLKPEMDEEKTSQIKKLAKELYSIISAIENYRSLTQTTSKIGLSFSKSEETIRDMHKVLAIKEAHERKIKAAEKQLKSHGLDPSDYKQGTLQQLLEESGEPSTPEEWNIFIQENYY